MMSAEAAAIVPRHDKIDIRISRFWTAEKKTPAVIDKHGNELEPATFRVVDMVSYYPTAQFGKIEITAPVDDIIKVRHDDDPMDLALTGGQRRAQIIQAHYNAWKRGSEAPVSGTPLESWGALSPIQLQLVSAAQIRTIQELAQASDTVLARIRLPNAKEIRAEAQRHLSAGNATRFHDIELRHNEEKNAMRKEIDDLKGMLHQLLEKFNPNPSAEADEPRRRGRPPNPRTETEQAA